MSGTLPSHIRTWHDFEAHFARLASHGIVNSIKDFYWDVRPKPEYGTIELRVLDTPLHPAYAAALACYARELCVEVAEAEGQWPLDDSPELYAWNRFNAAKNGVAASWIDPSTGVARPVRLVVLEDLERLARRTTDPGFGQASRMIEKLMRGGGQAGWLRSHMDSGSGMNDLSRVASEMFEHSLPGQVPVAAAPAADQPIAEVRA